MRINYFWTLFENKINLFNIMFACFGKSKKKKNKKKQENKDTQENKEKSENSNESDNDSEDAIKELEKEYLKLKIENENLTFSNENNQRQSLFLDSLLRNFKMNFTSYFTVETEENENDSKVQTFIKRERSQLQTKYEMLDGDYKIILSQYNKAYSDLEKATDPKISEFSKMDQKVFILENLLQQKKDTLQYLEQKFQQLKKKKKEKNPILIDDIFLNNNMPNTNTLLNQHNKQLSDDDDFDSFSDDKENSNIDNTGFQFQNNDGHKETIRKLVSDNIEFNRALYQRIYRQTIEENTKYEENVKKLNQIKKEIEEIKNPQSKNTNTNNASNAAVSTDTKSRNKTDEKEEKMIKEKSEELMNNKTKISNLLIEIENVKGANMQLEKEIGLMYEDLSTKFKSAVSLEKEIEKMKIIRRKVSMGSQNKANL